MPRITMGEVLSAAVRSTFSEFLCCVWHLCIDRRCGVCCCSRERGFGPHQTDVEEDEILSRDSETETDWGGWLFGNTQHEEHEGAGSTPPSIRLTHFLPCSSFYYV